MSPAFAGAAIALGGLVEADESEFCHFMEERSTSMKSGSDDRATVVSIRIGHRHPTSQVLLGLDEGVAVVLMPREGRLGSRLLVYGLIPVEPNIRAQKVEA